MLHISPSRIYVAAALACAAMLPAEAQAQLKESFEVEGTYNKEILYPEKLSRLPQRRRLTPSESEVPYELNGVEANFTPSGAPIPATSYGASRTDIAPRGYVNLELGSWLNASLEAGYAALSSREQTLDIWLRHNSTSLWRPYGDEFPDSRRRFSYQEALAARYTRSFEGAGRLDVGARYRFGYFNYYNSLPQEGVAPATQTLNDVDLSVGFTGERKLSTRNLWNVEAAVRHFAFRSGTRETALRLDGGYARRLAPASTLGIDAGFRWMLYGEPFLSEDAPEAYGNLRLAPFYQWQKGKVTLRAGVNVDLTFNADAASETGHYNVFHISPDVRFDFNSGRFAAWVHALGGQELQTLAVTADRNLYCDPFLQSTTPVYSPIDARAGVRINPFSGFSAEAEFQYKVTRNVIGGGWYPMWIYAASSGGEVTMPALDAPEGKYPTYGDGRARYNLSGFGVRLAASYRFAEIIEAHGEGTYTPQNATTGIFNGLDRPRWIVGAGLKVRPVKDLTIGVEYEYRGVRKVWSALEEFAPADPSTRAGGIAVPGQPTPGPAEKEADTPDAAGLRLPDIALLNAGVEWRLPRFSSVDMTVGFHARNILNHREEILPALPSEGVTFSGSLQILF